MKSAAGQSDAVAVVLRGIDVPARVFGTETVCGQRAEQTVFGITTEAHRGGGAQHRIPTSAACEMHSYSYPQVRATAVDLEHTSCAQNVPTICVSGTSACSVTIVVLANQITTGIHDRMENRPTAGMRLDGDL